MSKDSFLKGRRRLLLLLFGTGFHFFVHLIVIALEVIDSVGKPCVLDLDVSCFLLLSLHYQSLQVEALSHLLVLLSLHLCITYTHCNVPFVLSLLTCLHIRFQFHHLYVSALTAFVLLVAFPIVNCVALTTFNLLLSLALWDSAHSLKHSVLANCTSFLRISSRIRLFAYVQTFKYDYD